MLGALDVLDDAASEIFEGTDIPDGTALSDFVSLDPPPSGFLLEDDEYRSEYQPPPLRMKPVPREICLRAVSWLHFGHVFSASSLIDCSASHSCAHEEQAYS